MENGLCAATIASPTYNFNVKSRSISLSDATVWRVRTQRRAQNPTNSVIRVSRTRAAHWVASPFLTQFRAYRTIGRWARDTAHHTKYFGFGFIAASQQKTSSKCIHNPNRCGIANKKIFTFFCFFFCRTLCIFFLYFKLFQVCVNFVCWSVIHIIFGCDLVFYVQCWKSIDCAENKNVVKTRNKWEKKPNKFIH